MAPSPPSPRSPGDSPARAIGRLLITAGPTHEPIDAVRYIGNRSSGRLGVDLARAASERGVPATLLLGPGTVAPPAPAGPGDTPTEVVRFRTTADLEALLRERLPGCDTLVMAAAVADYRPVRRAAEGEKLRREQRTLTLELEPTPDLLAGCGERRRPDQTLVGFALEPADRLRQSAVEKLRRKRVDAIVANPLETMESDRISAEVFWRDGASDPTPGPIDKRAFAGWLLDLIAARRSAGFAQEVSP